MAMFAETIFRLKQKFMIAPPQLLHFYAGKLLKRIELYLLLSGLIVFLTATRHSDVDTKKDTYKKEAPTHSLAIHTIDSLIDFALNFQGVPYQYAGKTPAGFDCSGFTGYVFDHVGINLNASSRTQFNQGHTVEKDSIRRGDLVFFKISNHQINHVGIVTERTENQVYFIHATSSQGIKVDKLESPYYSKWLVGVRRIAG